MAAISQHQKGILTEKIDNFISTQGLKQLGIQCGYNTEAKFIPQELKNFSLSLTDLALPFIKDKENNENVNIAEVKEQTFTIIHERLLKDCVIIPQSEVGYDYPMLWVWIQSRIW